MQHSLVLFASGRGSNVEAIIRYFEKNGVARVALIVCNKPDAGVTDIARRENIPLLLIDRESIKQHLLIEQIKEYNPSLLVLAGFLWKIPTTLTDAFPDKIINIHPALLPKYGGRGMYGSHVHEAVISSGEQASGITIHYVNEVYDSGNIILQAHCAVSPTDTAETLASKVHVLEHFYFPRCIEQLLSR